MVIHYGRSGRRVKEIMKLELELGVIPIHRYKEEELFEMKEDELNTKKRMLEVWKQSQTLNA